MKAISSGLSRKLIGTAIAPRALAANIVSRNSGRFVIMTATRSPALTPRRAIAAATAVTRWSSCNHVVERPSKRRYTASGLVWACRTM
jgi:hypothetical protein